MSSDRTEHKYSNQKNWMRITEYSWSEQKPLYTSLCGVQQHPGDWGEQPWSLWLIKHENNVMLQFENEGDFFLAITLQHHCTYFVSLIKS